MAEGNHKAAARSCPECRQIPPSESEGMETAELHCLICKSAPCVIHSIHRGDVFFFHSCSKVEALSGGRIMPLSLSELCK